MRSGARILGSGCGNSSKTSLAAAVMILLWVFSFLSQFGSCPCRLMDAKQHYHLNKQQHLIYGPDHMFVKFTPRKLLRISQQKVFNAAAAPILPLQPPEPGQFISWVNGGGSEAVYEDDKRRVHTGPNPLHN